MRTTKKQTDLSSYNEYDHELSKKLLLIISVAGIIGAILTVIYRMIFLASIGELIVQLISIIVFGTSAVLVLTKSWVRRLIPFVIAVAFAQLLVTWHAYTLADYMARIIIIYVVVIIIVLLNSKVRGIVLALLGATIAFMIYLDVLTFNEQTIVFEYWDLLIDSLIVGTMIILIIALYKAYLEKTKKKLYGFSMKDPLTGAYNIRYFAQQMERFEQRWQTAGTSYMVAIADVNDFKIINDKHGHQTGDSTLQLIVSAVTAAMNSSCC